MQNSFNNDYRTHYIVEKILDYLPGNSLEIVDELSNFLQNPDVLVSPKRASQFKQVREFLKNAESATITRQVIQKKIYYLKNQPIPASKMDPLEKFKALIAHYYSLIKRPLCKRGQPVL